MSSSHRVDVGRLVLVPIFVALLVLNALKLLNGDGTTHALEAAGTVTALAFYGVLVLMYIRRNSATDTDRRWERWLVAGVATFSGFAIPLVGPGGTGPRSAAAGTVLIVIGVGLSVWALLHLRTNISVVPQSRELASDGPYRFFRHPLYVFEYISAIGLAIVNGGGWAWVVVGGIGVLQILRARWEEQLLSERVPGYAAYAARTPGFS